MKESERKRPNAQRAVWRNGGCGSLKSTAKQQVTCFVASVGSPPLRQAATTLWAMRGLCIGQRAKRQNVRNDNLTKTKQKLIEL